MKFKLAQLQMPVFEDKESSVAYMREMAERAVKMGADFLALPEMFACPYAVDNFPVYAESEGGPLWQACSELAGRLHVYLSAGSMPERDENGNIYNTAYVFDREGRQIARHRKMHLFDIHVEGGQHFQESATLTAGNTSTVFDTEYGRFGLCICYDFRFPELGRLMALKGAKVILVPAAFNMTTGPAHWELMFRSQALNQQVYAVGTAPARDEDGCYISWGHSIVAGPWGDCICQMDEKPGIQLTEIDLDCVGAVRHQLPLLAHRRTDVYTLQEQKPALCPPEHADGTPVLNPSEGAGGASHLCGAGEAKQQEGRG